VRVDGKDNSGASGSGQPKRRSTAARKQRGPRCYEAVTYRIGDHTTADDAARYRPTADGPGALKRADQRGSFRDPFSMAERWSKTGPRAVSPVPAAHGLPTRSVSLVGCETAGHRGIVRFNLSRTAEGLCRPPRRELRGTTAACGDNGCGKKSIWPPPARWRTTTKVVVSARRLESKRRRFPPRNRRTCSSVSDRQRVFDTPLANPYQRTLRRHWPGTG